ncbi:PadR family transcriptional regulator [Microbacterium gorillae]|uniref:PadR family transcriptional regulator n=1 Tax=Microbacterium gorillae TaxID=1231063 RepID=UPI0005916BDD|nr:helix-turn-helix transcriptional regulator [Microbacterium gorillae]
MQVGKDLVAATATPLVLGILAEGESYGYAILQRIAELSDGELQWSDGMLYPLLHRLERLGHVESGWQIADTGRRRKLYRLSPSGQALLGEQSAQWEIVTKALSRVWHDGGSPLVAGMGA